MGARQNNVPESIEKDKRERKENVWSSEQSWRSISDLECIFQSVTYDWETWITYTEKILGDSKEWGKE